MPPLPTQLPSLDDQPGPARPISDDQARALVRGALRRVIAGDKLGAEPMVARTPRLGRMARAAVITFGFLLGGAALAALSEGRLWSWSEHHETAASNAGSSGNAGKTAAPAPTRNPAPAPTPAETESEITAVIPNADQPGAHEDDDAPPATAPAPHPNARRLGAGANRSSRPTTHDKPAVPSTMRDAEDVLSLANHLRGERRWHEAAAAYQKIIATFPSTSTAYVATMARAELLLDHLDRPAEALQLFQRALGRDASGLLTEEARYGIAACYRAMGDRENERRALGLFLATQPHSLMRASVEARLAELR